MSNITDEDFTEAMDALAQYEKNEAEIIRKILDSIKEKVSKQYFEGIVSYIDSFYEEGSVSSFNIVNKNIKELTTEEEFNNIKTNINQTCNGGYTGDSYAGYVYIYISNNEYLEFYYDM